MISKKTQQVFALIFELRFIMWYNHFMKLKRFYFEPHNRHNNEIVLTEDEFLHAVTVLRIRVGEEVVAFCGDGKDTSLDSF